MKDYKIPDIKEVCKNIKKNNNNLNINNKLCILLVYKPLKNGIRYLNYNFYKEWLENNNNEVNMKNLDDEIIRIYNLYSV